MDARITAVMQNMSKCQVHVHRATFVPPFMLTLVFDIIHGHISCTDGMATLNKTREMFLLVKTSCEPLSPTIFSETCCMLRPEMESSFTLTRMSPSANWPLLLAGLQEETRACVRVLSSLNCCECGGWERRARMKYHICCNFCSVILRQTCATFQGWCPRL